MEQLPNNPTNYFCPERPRASVIPGVVLRSIPGNILNGGHGLMAPDATSPKIVFSERQVSRSAETIERMIDEFHEKNPDAVSSLSQFAGVESLLGWKWAIQKRPSESTQNFFPHSFSPCLPVSCCLLVCCE